MGYGFSLAENSADRFSIAFTPVIAAYIESTEERRLSQNEVSVPNGTAHVSRGEPGAISLHWVSVHQDEPQFSHNFFEEFSIAIENRRECRQADTSPQSTLDLFGENFSRKKLHLLCAILMILQRSQRAIRKNDKSLPEHPQNLMQVDAERYRRKQLDILDKVCDSSARKLSTLLAKDAQIIRLEEVLTGSPQRLQKDIRHILNAGLKTRDPRKIKERGGIDFAFTVWLCGLLLCQVGVEGGQERASEAKPVIDDRHSRWLRLLQREYPEETKPSFVHEDSSEAIQNADRAAWFDPVRNSVFKEDVEADADSVVASYLDVIQVAAKKHPQSLYNSPYITVRRLKWCHNVIIEEGVWLPSLEDGEGEDEWVLYLDK